MIRSLLLCCSLFLASFSLNAQCSATISGGGEICEGWLIDLTFTMTGTAPWTVVYSVNGIPQTIIIAASPHTVTLAPVESETIELVSLEDGTGCLGTVSGTVNIVVNSAPIAIITSLDCDPTATSYTVTFEIAGGDPSTYSVIPPDGTLTGNVFTSNPIPGGTPFTFTVDDANACGPAIVTGGFSCDCTSQAGQMDQTPTDICGDGPITATYDSANEFLDGNDVLRFYLHTNSGINLGTIIASNSTPEFPFDPSTMNYGQTYYISAAVGNDDGNGEVDLNDFCLSVSAGTPVTFHDNNLLLFSCTNPILTCSQPTVPIICTTAGGTFPYTYIWSNGSASQSPLVNSPGIYSVTIVDAVGCSLSTSVTVESDINVPTCSINVVDELSCNILSVEATPDCLGGTPPYSFLWSNGQTTQTATFDTPGTYSLSVTDGNDCLSLSSFAVGFNNEGCGTINGNIRDDINLDCMADQSETPLLNWTVRASNGTSDYFDLTNGNGFYEIEVPPGDYTVEIINNLPDFWDACAPSVNVIVEDEFDTETVDFPLQKLVECPSMEVDISTPLLRRCFTNFFYVSYCNNGTTTAEDATVEVVFDTDFTINSASVPFTNPSAGLYIFEIGDVGIGQCGNFTINTTLSCNAVLGETICTEAHIFPDTSCVEPDPLWSGASLQITSECVGGEVIFTITNTGEGDMAEPSYFIVIEDGVMLTNDPQEVFLLAGASTTVTYPANGSTYILQLDQVSNHPGLSAPLLAFEGCGVNGLGSFSTGFVTQFPEDDADPFISIDCRTVVGSYDPNDKYGYPEGYGDEHFIDLGQDLEYRIRFQNTGTDTAFKVVIQDVLSPLLDITTLRPGVSSHPYELSILGSDTLVFTFNDILLPDSNINEALSHGFVKFRIDQAASNVLGDVIENEAAIYFDFNDPVITNKTVHKIGEHFIMTAIEDVQHPLVQHVIQPNPSSGEATISLSGQVPSGEMTVNVFGIAGQLAHSQTLFAPIGKLHFGTLKTGLYFYEIKMQEGVIGRGRLVIQ